MWLRDFLPESISNARILTYGYDTKLPGSQSTATILELSRKLLESVKTIRSQHEVGLCNDSFTWVRILTCLRKIDLSSSLDIA